LVINSKTLLEILFKYREGLLTHDSLRGYLDHGTNIVMMTMRNGCLMDNGKEPFSIVIEILDEMRSTLDFLLDRVLHNSWISWALDCLFLSRDDSISTSLLSRYPLIYLTPHENYQYSPDALELWKQFSKDLSRLRFGDHEKTGEYRQGH
jgi:hypothetical protein